MIRENWNAWRALIINLLCFHFLLLRILDDQIYVARLLTYHPEECSVWRGQEGLKADVNLSNTGISGHYDTAFSLVFTIMGCVSKVMSDIVGVSWRGFIRYI